MDGHHWFAIALAFLLVGSTLATQPRLSRDTGLEADDHGVVQQHTVFLEIVVEDTERRENRDEEEEIVEFSAVVGLVVRCQTFSSTFDNAVLWFNDQFLFGHKASFTEPVIEDDALGPPPVEGPDPDECAIPNGFVHAVPAGQADGVHQTLEEEASPGTYEESYYVTDPNGHPWLVDVHTVDGTVVYTVHLQVDETGQAFRDEAPWAYREDGTIRNGTPRNESLDDGADPHDRRAIPYDFLVAVSIDDIPVTGEREHGEGGLHETNSSKQGNSHPHNANDTRTRTDEGECVDGADGLADTAQDCEDDPRHLHNAAEVEVFFSEDAPERTEADPYWNDRGSPPAVDDDCNGTSGDPERDRAVDNRTFAICNTIGEQAPYHAHDGSQTIRPS